MPEYKEIYRNLTTSTGEPMQTAKKPAPKPDKRWVTTLSVNPGIFRTVCIGMNTLDIDIKIKGARCNYYISIMHHISKWQQQEEAIDEIHSKNFTCLI